MKPTVADVAIDHRRLAGDDRVRRLRSVLVAGRDLDLVGLAVLGGLLVPAGDLLHAALGVFVERIPKQLEEVGAVALDEPRPYSAKCSEDSVTK
jgi:hypothetical protein